MNTFKQTLEKMKQQQQILAILIFAFVTVIIWITTSVLTSQLKTGIDNDLLKLAKPLTPTIDQEVIQRLMQQDFFLDSQLQDFPIYMIVKDRRQIEQIVEIGAEPEPTPSLSSSPKPNSSLNLNFSPGATSSAADSNNQQENIETSPQKL